MENKYYQPDISELYVGYETNFISGKGLDTLNNIKNIVITVYNIKTIERDISLVRTKYLDSDDIISLGFEKLDAVCPYFGKNKYLYKIPNKEGLMDGFKIQYVLEHQQSKIRIERQKFGGFIGLHESYEQVYYGKCKSVNELKKILEWIK